MGVKGKHWGSSRTWNHGKIPLFIFFHTTRIILLPHPVFHYQNFPALFFWFALAKHRTRLLLSRAHINVHFGMSCFSSFQFSPSFYPSSPRIKINVFLSFLTGKKELSPPNHPPKVCMCLYLQLKFLGDLGTVRTWYDDSLSIENSKLGIFIFWILPL